MRTMKIVLPHPLAQSVLACGSQTKNTLCFVSGVRAYVSDVHQDMTVLTDRSLFEKDAAYFLRKHPHRIACDMHPDYTATKFAHTSASAGKLRLVEVQHQHAHIVSCMVDNGVGNRKVIGVAFDGTGFGADATLWGGELLLCDYRAYHRLAHIAGVPLLGGAQAIRQPWRLAFVWLERAYGTKMFRLPLKIMKRVYCRNWEVLTRMREHAMNAPITTSAGRLFDAAASIILDAPTAEGEAALAIALEASARRSKAKPAAYPWVYAKDPQGVLVIDPVALIAAIVRDIRSGKKKEDIALCFHETIAAIIERTCSGVRRTTGVELVALSGGVFQNSLLRERAQEKLQKKGFRVLTHRVVPCSDAGISIGQAVIAGSSR